MSAITRAAQHGQMLKDIEELKRIVLAQAATMAAVVADLEGLAERINTLEQKRGPGRPPKNG